MTQNLNPVTVGITGGSASGKSTLAKHIANELNGHKSVIVNQDLYFRTKDNEIESKYIKNASLRPIDSPFGHCAANPGNDKNFELQLDKNISELLN